MKKLSHLLKRVTSNLAVILLGLFFILGTDGDYPIITILGDNPTIATLGNLYTDAGATAEDKKDGKIDIITTGLDIIDTSIVKNYTVTYTATDSDKNTSIATRLVKVVKKIITIEAPKNLKASVGDQQITLIWSKVTNADKYTIYMAEETGLTPENYSVYKSGTMLDNKVSPFIVTGLKNGKTYYFIATASKETVKSKASNEVFATPQKVVIPPQSLGKLNDTGITSCSDGFDKDLNCPVVNYPRQDAEFGSNSMSFTKIGVNGKELPESATEWSCVKDNVTKLIWEIKNNDGGLHDKYNTYTWYNPNSYINGGNAGTENGNSDTHSFVIDVNTESWCGASDWRIPTREELRSIVSYDRFHPPIDEIYFPYTITSSYWSFSPVANYGGSSAWCVSFFTAQDSWCNKQVSNYVRVVRSQ